MYVQSDITHLQNHTHEFVRIHLFDKGKTIPQNTKPYWGITEIDVCDHKIYKGKPNKITDIEKEGIIKYPSRSSP